MKREFSAGGIVFNSQNQVLLVKAGSLRDRSKSHWKFPKGHVDPGETTKGAAIREVREEAGIEAEIIEKVGDSKYTYTMNGEKIFKVVTYFYMKYKSGEVNPQVGEIEEAIWVEAEKAKEMLSFSVDKKLLDSALFMMRSKNKPN